MRPVVALAVLGAILACVAAPPVRAHGDPASEYLAGHQVYLPFDLEAAPAEEQQLVALVGAANRASFALRVALVWSRSDLGARSALWRKPQSYALYLESDLRGSYKNRVLVVMPNGFGFGRLGHSTAAGSAALATIRIKPGPTGFVDASLTAVRALALASGVALSGTTVASASSRSHDRLVILLVALVALALAVLLRTALRRRR